MDVFVDYVQTLNYSNRDSTDFGSFLSVAYLSSVYTTYYVIDFFYQSILMFDNDWSFLGSKSFGFEEDKLGPNYIISIDHQLFISTDQEICQVDELINIIKCFDGGELGAYRYFHFRCIFYNNVTNLIYAADSLGYCLLLFHLNLTISDEISIPRKFSWPKSLNGYGDTIYVGTDYGTIIRLYKKVIVDTFVACPSNGTVSSILLDQLGFMAVSCSDINEIYLFYSNGTSANKKMNVNEPEYIYFDSKGRFVITTGYNIIIMAKSNSSLILETNTTLNYEASESSMYRF